MKVILLQDVKSLGKKGEIVTVSDAYARNVIFAKKLGLEATGKNLNDLKLQKNNEKKVAEENLEAAKELAAKIAEAKIVTHIKVGEGGRTFGSVSSKEIAEEVKSDLFEIEPKVPYTKPDLDWMNKKSRSSVEMSDKKYRPAIMKKEMDMSSYDEILLGFPKMEYSL
jgi:large subunit ribosomal protein L9